MIRYKFFIIFIILCNCNTRSDTPLELTILNEKIYAYCPDKTCIDFNKFKQKDINDKKVNILKFRITNNTNKTYLLMPICNYIGNDCANFMSFPKIHAGISLDNLVFKNDKDEIVSYKGHIYPFGDFEKVIESQIVDYYVKTGYNLDEIEALFIGYSQEGLMIIPAGETLYFESFVTLPYNKPFMFSSQEYIELDKKDTYNVSMRFTSNEKIIRKRLTDSQKKTIEKNDYKVFDGELISKNSIPLIFINDR